MLRQAKHTTWSRKSEVNTCPSLHIAIPFAHIQEHDGVVSSNILIPVSTSHPHTESQADTTMNTTPSWLPSLLTENPESGFALALKLSRMAVKFTQPSDAVRSALRPDYESDADALIAASHVVAVNFATIAAANGYWR